MELRSLCTQGPGGMPLTLPSSLQNLIGFVNQGLGNVAPQSLSCGHCFNQSLDNTTLPSTLQSLLLGLDLMSPPSPLLRWPHPRLCLGLWEGLVRPQPGLRLLRSSWSSSAGTPLLMRSWRQR